MIVLDFDGGEVLHSAGVGSDPGAQTTPLDECTGIWPPYGDQHREDAILDAVADLFADFNVIVTTEEQHEAPHVKILIGPFVGCGHGVGYAEDACDRRLAHSLVFAKLDPDGHRTVMQEAVVIAHEVGHALGLAHVDDPSDVMHASVGDGNKRFVDHCGEYESNSLGGDACPLTGQCPTLDPVGQNSWVGLASILGVSNDPSAASDHESGCSCRGGGTSSFPVVLWIFVAFSFPSAVSVRR